jgi:hypothetical protein
MKRRPHAERIFIGESGIVCLLTIGRGADFDYGCRYSLDGILAEIR